MDSLQLRVLRLGFLQDGDVGGGVLPPNHGVRLRPQVGLAEVGERSSKEPGECLFSRLQAKAPGTRIFVGMTGVALLPRMTQLLRGSVSGNLIFLAPPKKPP